MTCKDCIHYGVCGGFTPTDLDQDVFDYCREGRTDEIPDIEERCGEFKDKSRYIEIHCKVGDTVYHINKTPFGGEVYELEIFDVSLRKGKPYYETESIDFDNTAIGKSIFLTKEGAEAKMKGGEQE